MHPFTSWPNRFGCEQSARRCGQDSDTRAGIVKRNRPPFQANDFGNSGQLPEPDPMNFVSYPRWVAAAAALVASAFVAGCEAPNAVSKADARIVQAQPVASKARTFERSRVVTADEPDFVPEPVAQAALTQLRQRGKAGNEIAEALLYCSAIEARQVNQHRSCFGDHDDEGASTTCLMKRGVGKNSVGRALTADRFDLNGDGTPDFILSDRYNCRELTANQASVYLVLLSGPGSGHQLAYADWVSNRLEVVADPVSTSLVLVQRAEKTYGMFTRIMSLAEGRYAERACIVQDERGMHPCEP